MSVEVAGGLVRIEFNNSVLPVFKEPKNRDYVYYGANDDYPVFVIDLYNKHPEHCAIIKMKSKYIFGKGLDIKRTDYSSLVEAMRATNYLKRANRFEDWNSVYKKTIESLEIFNGFYWQIIWNLAGTACEVFPLQFAKCRVSQDGKSIYYSDKWLDDNCRPVSHPEYQEFPVFDPSNRKGTQVYFYKVTDQYYDGIGDTYPLPEYKGAMINIYTDIAVSEFQNTLALHGMTAQGMLTLFKGEPTEDERKKIERMFDNRFTGPAGKKVILNFTNDQGDRGAEWTTFQTSDLDKQFELISKTNQQKIITGHQVPNKSLVGISVEGALSDRTSIDISFEQMTNTYTEPRRELILEEIKMIGSLCGYDLTGIFVKPLKPLGLDYLNPNIQKFVTSDEIRLALGLDPLQKEETSSVIDAINTLSPLVANEVLTSMTEDEIRALIGLGSKNPGMDPVSGQPVNSGPINENLKALSGRDWQHIKRLQREVEKGKTKKEVAAMLIKSAYGLSDSDIDILLGAGGQQVAQFNLNRRIDDILKLYEMASIEDNNPEYEGYEFASKILESQVLDLLKGEPTATPNKIATMLEEDLDEVEQVLKSLQTKGLVDNSYQPTQKGIETKTRTPDVEVYTVYKYVTRDDVPRAHQSREFCKRLLELTNQGKVWTKEAIDNLSNEFGEDAWSYRGGWYTHPNTGETTTYCRHVWKAVRKVRTK